MPLTLDLPEKFESDFALLESWLTETDSQVISEQQETWRDLRQALETNHNGLRELFPAQQKGKSW